MNKCKGCGITLTDNKDDLGYSSHPENRICDRCFKIKNYNYKDDIKISSNEEIIKKVNSKKRANLFLCDIFSLNNEVMETYSKIIDPKILVITKIDTLAKNIDANSLREKICKNYNLNDAILVSIKSGYGKNDVLDYIKYYKKTLLCGPTSSGKSSLINYLFNEELTVSSNSNTTRDLLKVNFDDLTIYDAPGFNFSSHKNLSNYKGTINPKTIRLKKEYELYINNEVISFENDANLTVFFPSNINITTKKKTLNRKFERINEKRDILVSNFGFIYLKEKNKIFYENDNISIRKSLVGGFYE